MDIEGLLISSLLLIKVWICPGCIGFSLDYFNAYVKLKLQAYNSGYIIWQLMRKSKLAKSGVGSSLIFSFLTK